MDNVGNNWQCKRVVSPWGRHFCVGEGGGAMVEVVEVGNERKMQAEGRLHTITVQPGPRRHVHVPLGSILSRCS